MPRAFPNWRSVHTRWRRWVQRRIWPQVLAWLAEEHDREACAVDATYVRVHAHGIRARGGYTTQAVGRSRGGLTSKVHLLTDALGYPVRFVVTAGECNDVTQAPALLPRAPARRCCVIAAMMRDVYPPSMNLSFRLIDAEGKVLAGGTRHLRDCGYLQTSPIPSRDPWRYDKGMISSWMRMEFKRS